MKIDTNVLHSVLLKHDVQIVIIIISTVTSSMIFRLASDGAVLETHSDDKKISVCKECCFSFVILLFVTPNVIAVEKKTHVL